MSSRYALVSGLAMLCLASMPVPADPVDRVVFDNGTVQRTLERVDGAWRTTGFSLTEDPLKVTVDSEEFLVQLWNGSTVTVADYECDAGTPPTTTVSEGGMFSCPVRYTARPDAPPDAPRSVTVVHTANLGEPYLRKQVVVAMAEGGAVDRLEVERFTTSLTCRQGGRGEPVFVGPRAFAGLEYPGSQTRHEAGRVTLAHFPGRAAPGDAPGTWAVRSKLSVVGLAPGETDQRAFFDAYLESIRIPLRNMLHYNSWYDLRNKEVNPERLVETFKAFKGPLCDAYGIDMDTFVPDDGYQDKNSIWRPRASQFPDGFVGLRDQLQALGTRLGLWLPLNGYLLNVEWGAKRGLERARVRGEPMDYYCLSGPRYHQAIREALERVITEGNLAYMKHDFNYLGCDAEGHGHLPSLTHGREANLDAHLALLAYERSLQPGIFLNVTSASWHSPWWLQHADTIWMNASDHGFDFSYPQLSPREGAMSFRDIHFFKVLLEQQHLVPLSAYMTHGIILGRYETIGGDEETMREWSDYCFLYYGRGVQLKELYISPDLMTPERWRILGETTRWAIGRKDQLAAVRMFGSDPRTGGAYGYAHWRGDRGLVVVRNPGLAARDVNIPLDEDSGFLGEPGVTCKARVVYPYVEDLPGSFISGQDAVLPVPGATVMALEFAPGEAGAVTPAVLPAPPACTTTLDPEGRKLYVRVPVPDEDMPACTLRIVTEGVSVAPGQPAFLVEGEPVRARESNGSDWSMRSLDLREHRGRAIDIVVQLPAGADALFLSDLKVSAWLVMDRAVEAEAAPAGELLPFLPSQHHRRQTHPLLPAALVPYRHAARKVSAEDLAGIKTAGVRLLVYGVNAGGPTGKKAIHLNGRPVARVPASAEPIDSWQERFVELDAAAAKRIALTNVLQLDNADRDYYKFRGLALAVQLADGTWVRSNVDEEAHTSVSDWAHFEGTGFQDGMSAPIPLSF
jgi:hypothetical protein